MYTYYLFHISYNQHISYLFPNQLKRIMQDQHYVRTENLTKMLYFCVIFNRLPCATFSYSFSHIWIRKMDWKFVSHTVWKGCVELENCVIFTKLKTMQVMQFMHLVLEMIFMVFWFVILWNQEIEKRTVLYLGFIICLFNNYFGGCC